MATMQFYLLCNGSFNVAVVLGKFSVRKCCMISGISLNSFFIIVREDKRKGNVDNIQEY